MVQMTRTAMTAEQFLALPETSQMTELIEGEFVMAPPPNTDHQIVSGNLYFYLRTLVPLGRWFHAPTGVYLDETTILEPDILWVSQDNLAKIKRQYVEGAPDLVIEIFSPGTAKRDKSDKFVLYQGHGVREYWTVDPLNRYVEVYVLTEATFVVQGTYEAGDSFGSPVLGQTVAVDPIFA